MRHKLTFGDMDSGDGCIKCGDHVECYGNIVFDYNRPDGSPSTPPLTRYRFRYDKSGAVVLQYLYKFSQCSCGQLRKETWQDVPVVVTPEEIGVVEDE